MFYVEIERINGRIELMSLAEVLESQGYDDRVEYYPGDSFCPPHLRFEHEDDAVAYALTYGKTVKKETL